MTDTTWLSDYEVAARYSVTAPTVWRWVRTEEGFPQPIKLSGGTTRWRLDQLVAWEEFRAEAAKGKP
jgi:predicted DNA-binding transcriptional regulator AlpA